MCCRLNLTLFGVILIGGFVSIKCETAQDAIDVNCNATDPRESIIIDRIMNETKYLLETTAINLNNALIVEGRKKEKKDLMSKILPMLAIPFLISSSIIPMMLVALKMMLLKSMFVGKMGILLLALNALWRVNNQGGVYSHNINISADEKDLMHEHYGYDKGEEYGAYVNK